MKTIKLDCVLSYDLKKSVWKISCDTMRVTSGDWEALKEKLEKEVRKKFPGKTVELSYYFDMNSIPVWFHQYQNHYFNGKFKFQNK